MRFNKIYIEITNICNLQCSFFSPVLQKRKEMNIEEFEHIIKQVKTYTHIIYLHVKGEPLLHSQLNEILNICQKEKLRVQIPTNGTLLKDKVQILKKYDCIHKLNISLHCENNYPDYFNSVFNACDVLNTYIIYRLWTLQNNEVDSNSMHSIHELCNHYHLDDEIKEKLIHDKTTKINDHIYVDKDNEFIWPDLKNKIVNQKSYCHALKTHIAILSNGDVIPCCLDSQGILKLGNIFEEDLDTILNKDRTKQLRKQFTDRKITEPLCLRCGFLSRNV